MAEGNGSHPGQGAKEEPGRDENWSPGALTRCPGMAVTDKRANAEGISRKDQPVSGYQAARQAGKS